MPGRATGYRGQHRMERAKLQARTTAASAEKRHSQPAAAHQWNQWLPLIQSLPDTSAPKRNWPSEMRSWHTWQAERLALAY